MPNSNFAEMKFDVSADSVPTPSTHTPEPTDNTASAKAAVRRCNAAYQRAYKATLQQEAKNNPFATMSASIEACTAYCNAMPALVGEEGIRDFLACAAHGVLIGAIPQNKGTQVIYAAQVTLSLLNLQLKQPRTLLAPPSNPAPLELPPPPSPAERIEIEALKRANRFK